MEDHAYLAEMTGAQVLARIKQGGVDKVIAVFGSTENHGPHLPYCNDAFIPMGIARRVAAGLGDAVILPPVFYGVTPQHMSFPLTMTLRIETFIALVTDLLESVYAHGIRKVLIINEHDGNVAALQTAARFLRRAHPDLHVALFEGWWLPEQLELRERVFEQAGGWGHAGEGETSVAMALHPGLVDLSVARGTPQIPRLPEHLWLNWEMHELSETGAFGSPEKATAEKGERVVSTCVDYLVKTVKQLDAINWDIAAWAYGREEKE